MAKTDNRNKCTLYVSKSPSILDEKIEDLKKAFSKKIDLETDFKMYYGTDEIDDAELIDFLSMPSFFSDIKIAVIKDINKIPANSLKRFAKFLMETKDSPRNYLVVMTASDEKMGKDMKKSIQQCCNVERKYEPDASSLNRWLKEKEELDGIGFTVKARNLLLSSVGNDLGFLKKEYEKLLTYIIDDKDVKIDEEAVSRLVIKKYDDMIFDLIDYIGARDKNKSFKALKSILTEDQNLMGFIVLLHRMFKTLIYIKSDPSGMLAGDYIDKNIRVNPRFKNKLLAKYKKHAERYSFLEIKNIFGKINKCDMDLRSSVAEPAKVIERMIFDIIETKSP